MPDDFLSRPFNNRVEKGFIGGFNREGESKFALIEPGVPRTPDKELWFQYTPNDFKEYLEVTYDDVEAEGRPIHSLQYRMGKPRRITFKLFVNELGMYFFENNRRSAWTPEETVRWLRARMYASGSGANMKGPTVFYFIGWELIRVVVTKATIDRDIVRQNRQGGFLNGSKFKNRINNKKQRSENEMVRGTIQLELVEYSPPPFAGTQGSGQIPRLIK